VTRSSCKQGRCSFSVHLTKALNYDVTPVYNLVFVAEDGAQRLKQINRARHAVNVNVVDEKKFAVRQKAFANERAFAVVGRALWAPTRWSASPRTRPSAVASSAWRRSTTTRSTTAARDPSSTRLSTTAGWYVRYSSPTSPQASRHLTIDPSSGWVFVSTALDRDSAEMTPSNGVLSMIVRATEVSANGEETSADRTVTVNVVSERSTR